MPVRDWVRPVSLSCVRPSVRNLARGVRFADFYRTVPESRILDMLLLGGWAYERGTPEAVVETKRALNSWVDMGLGVQFGPMGERLFDPVEVVNVLKSLGMAGRDSFWAERYVATGRRMVTDLAAESRGPFVVIFKRTFNVRPSAKGKVLRLRAPLPLTSIYGDNLEIVPFVEGALDAPLSITDGRLEARLAANPGTLTLGASLRFTPGTSSERDMSPADKVAYLKPREGLIVVSNAVSALATKLAAPSVTATSAVQSFWRYMIDELACGAIHYDQVPADAPCDMILDTGWYDCQLGSALFIALCRARGIPARLAGGHVLYRRAPTNHYWAEVWLDENGWVPFDFLSWDLSLGGADLQWRDHFYGRIDKRMITQILPFKFTGAVGVEMPNQWHIVQTAQEEGVLISLLAVGGHAIYSDFVSISD